MTVKLQQGAQEIDSEVLDHHEAESQEATVTNDSDKVAAFAVLVESPVNPVAWRVYPQFGIGMGAWLFQGVSSGDKNVYHGAIFTELRR